MFIEELSGASLNGLAVDLKASIGHSRTEYEFKEDKTYDSILGTKSSENHLYGLMLSILSKNVVIFKYLFEEVGIQFNEADIIHLLKTCLHSHWP